jgi:hypothetical protein
MSNLTDFFPATSSSNVLEVVQGTCDGRSITVGSGTYTLGNVTTYQTFTQNYSDVTGSSITYMPPANTKYVSYLFNFMWDATHATGISHWKLDIDGTDIYKAAKTFSSNYSGSTSHHHGNNTAFVYYVIDLTASSDDAVNGKFSSWSTPKTLKVRARDYRSSTTNYYRAAAHYNVYYSTLGFSQYSKPNLTITAYS